MPTKISRWPLLLALTSILAPASQLSAADQVPTIAPLPKPAEIQSLAIYPTKVALNGGDEAAQLILTATLTDGRLFDLTGDAQYSVADGKTVRVTSLGKIIPRENGATEITASFAGKTVKVPVSTVHVGENLPINFGNQVVPVFTKLGCNSGGCHGKASGQNGFKLSLLGFDPELDFMTLVKEARGRRLMPASPESSLLLLKAIGAAPHGGGKKMEKDSDEYRIVRRWIASGSPFGLPTDPVVTKITMYPEQRIMSRHSKQQFAVYAHYSDDTIEDITRRAQYDSNDQDIATVDPNGLVSTLGLSGQAAIMARYRGHVATFRASVPLGSKVPEWQFPQQTVVDLSTSKKWKELGIAPSELCSDEIFIRRVYLDLTGTLPNPTQIKTFLGDKDPKKREKLIDALVDSPEFSFYFANKWADILRVKRGRDGDAAKRAQGTFAFHNWIRETVSRDMPYDQFVRAILGATGDESNNPPTVWYKDLKDPEQFVDDTAQVFLGLRIACAQCHHHPYEKWSQDDYWGLAAFFGRVGRKQVPVIGGAASRYGTGHFQQAERKREQQAHGSSCTDQTARRRANDYRFG